MSEEMSLDDVLAGLEGEDVPEYKRSFGIEEGIYPVRIQDAELSTFTFPNGATVPTAELTLEILDARYNNFTRDVRMFLGKNTKTNEWQDQQFRQTVRRLLPDDVFEKKVAKAKNPVEAYKASIEELKGREGRMNFRKRKYEDKETGDEKITEAAYPVGALLSPAPEESASTTSSDF